MNIVLIFSCNYTVRVTVSIFHIFLLVESSWVHELVGRVWWSQIKVTHVELWYIQHKAERLHNKMLLDDDVAMMGG